MIMEIADNLEKCEDLVESDRVKEVLSMRKDAKTSKMFATILVKTQFVYLTTYLLSALKAIDPENKTKDISDALNNLITIARTDLQLETETILEFMEPVWKVVLHQITPEQSEPVGRFMSALHQIILQQDDLPFIPSMMSGVEDLYLYVANNWINLTQARLKHYRSSKLTKSQLFTLLMAADFSSEHDPSLLLSLLAPIQLDPKTVTEQDFESLSLNSRIALKIFFTIPKRHEGEICTSHESLKQVEPVTWKLPEELFITEDDYKNITVFPLAETLYNLPRLFLYRVFGFPLHNFAEVGQIMSEFPEMRELIDISNFFLDRWCSNNPDGPYTRIKIVTSN